MGLRVKSSSVAQKPMLCPPRHTTMPTLPNIHKLIVMFIDMWASCSGYMLLCVWMSEAGCLSDRVPYVNKYRGCM